MLATTLRLGRFHSTTENAGIYRPTSFPDAPPAIWFHGNGQTAQSDRIAYYAQLQALAQGYTVIGGDFAGNSFGSDTGLAQVALAKTWLGGQGLAGPVTLVGASMGACVALNYAVRNLANVRACALIIPALDLRVEPGHPAADEIDAAYPPAYDDNDPDDAAHNPIHFADDMPGLPIHLFTSSDDPVVPPATADAFVAARPETERTVFGAYGHGGIGVAMPLVIDWLDSLD